jgi:hypothetical protein
VFLVERTKKSLIAHTQKNMIHAIVAFILLLARQAVCEISLTTPPYTRLEQAHGRIDMSEDGQFMVVGRALDGVYVFNRTAGVWGVSGVKLPITLTTTDIQDGIGVATNYDGTYVVMCGLNSDIWSSAVLVRSGESWSQQSGTFTLSDATDGR